MNDMLNLVLNCLIPAQPSRSVPGGGEVGVDDFLENAAAFDPDPQQVVTTILTAIAQQQTDFAGLSDARREQALAWVETEMPDIFARFLRLVYIGYYGQPALRPLFGVGAHPVHPGGYAVQPEDAATIDSLTAPVRRRGRIYRDHRGHHDE
ncbi:gluconate 2-dehydrogenase subunit 3 family protein [Paracoccus homiensis]|uniref:gluconate 2-dehydrogenase subunit 3 family protein n=1 Tax=Paracoccus homiensis TaxID=364199 RepID=UPI00398D043E